MAERFDQIVKLMQKDIPGINIYYKTDSLLMKVISKILFFNKTFMTDYVTTIGKNIYFTNRENIEIHEIDSIITLAHEYRHIKDYQDMGNIKYSILYLFPQILSLLFIPFYFIIGTWSLLFLLFLFPFPSYFRKEIELNGYKMTLFAAFILLKQLKRNDEHIKEILNNLSSTIDEKYFKSSAYYYMWPFGVKKELEFTVEKIISGKIKNDNDIYSVVEGYLK